MRSRAITWVACLLACAATSLAQKPNPPFEPTKVMGARLRWLDYKMVAGRVTATSAYPVGMNISFGPSEVGGRLRERLQLLILDQNQASVRYRLEGDGQLLEIVLGQGGDFSIDRTRDKPRLAISYAQRDGHKVALTVSEADGRQHFEADSFWHLYLAEPEIVRRHLIAHLELLRPAWQLAATAWAVEEALIQRARDPQSLDTDRWARLVEALASEKFSERQRAQRDLMRIGQVVLPYLEGLDRARLDAEQASRIDGLIDALSIDYEDTPERVAAWLVADPQVWLSLLARDDPAKRTVAVEQLRALGGGPIDFDPAGDLATRRVQLDRLKARYAGSGSASPLVPPPGVER